MGVTSYLYNICSSWPKEARFIHYEVQSAFGPFHYSSPAFQSSSPVHRYSRQPERRAVQASKATCILLTFYGHVSHLKKVCQWEGHFCQMLACSLAPPKTQLRAPLSPLQTAWTGFDPNLYSGGSSSAGPTLVEIATARSFILNRGIVTNAMSATPLEPGW